MRARVMHDGGLLNALDGWLGKAIGGVIVLFLGWLGGWWTRRPLEKAGILEAVNHRIEAYMRHLEEEVKRITANHARCEERLDVVEETNRKQAEEIRLLRGQVAQEKQTADSARRLLDS
jgi:hypothetical protein